MTSLLTIKQFAEKHKAFSELSLRHKIFFAETNGFATAIRRVGRRVYIIESEFFAAIERQNTRSISNIKGG